MNNKIIYIVGSISGTAAIAGNACTPRAQTKQPDIICIITDQQSASMMGCAGNKWLKTPAMDYIAENGVRFTRAYTTNPISSSARVSLMTERFPGYFRDNNGKQIRETAHWMKFSDSLCGFENPAVGYAELRFRQALYVKNIAS